MSTNENAAPATDPPAPEGDAVRFAALWERHAARVQAYALRHVDRDTAQEVVSETFLVAWRRLADVPGDPLPWLLVVARNTVANQRRSHHRARLLAHEVARLELVMPRPSDATDGLVAERDALLRALAALTGREREALLLVAWDGLSPVQAAAVAGCSPTAFKVRLHRARRRLDAALVVDDDTRPATSSPPDPSALAPSTHGRSVSGPSTSAPAPAPPGPTAPTSVTTARG